MNINSGWFLPFVKRLEVRVFGSQSELRIVSGWNGSDFDLSVVLVWATGKKLLSDLFGDVLGLIYIYFIYIVIGCPVKFSF